MRRAFTLVEIIVVLAIIVLLVGILVPAVAMMRNSARRSASDKTMTIVAQAVSQYLAEYGALAPAAGLADGSNGDLGAILLSERKGVSLLDRTTGTVDAQGRLIDGFRQPLRWCAVTETRYGRLHTSTVILASASGTPERTDDDLVDLLDVASGGWKRIRYAAIPDASWVPK